MSTATSIWFDLTRCMYRALLALTQAPSDPEAHRLADEAIRRARVFGIKP
jgi:hypothetical protein